MVVIILEIYISWFYMTHEKSMQNWHSTSNTEYTAHLKKKGWSPSLENINVKCTLFPICVSADLRQDMLTLQILQVMDNIWQAEGYDLR